MLTRIISKFLPSWRDLWSDCAFRTLFNKRQHVNYTRYISNTRRRCSVLWMLSPVCEVVVGVGHVDQTLDEVCPLNEAEEHLQTHKQTHKHQIKKNQAVDDHHFNRQLEERLPQSAGGCAGLSRAPRWTCEICPARLVCVGCRRGRTRRRRRGRPGPGLQGPQQTGRSASAGRPGSRAATAMKTTHMKIPFRHMQIKLLRLWERVFIERFPQRRSGLSHHSPGLLVFGLQDAWVEDLQEQLQTSGWNELQDGKKNTDSRCFLSLTVFVCCCLIFTFTSKTTYLRGRKSYKLFFVWSVV